MGQGKRRPSSRGRGLGGLRRRWRRSRATVGRGGDGGAGSGSLTGGVAWGGSWEWRRQALGRGGDMAGEGQVPGASGAWPGLGQ